MGRTRLWGVVLGISILVMGAYPPLAWAEKRYITATYSHSTGKLTYDLPYVPYCRYFPSFCWPGHELYHTVEIPFHFTTITKWDNGVYQRMNIMYPYRAKLGVLSSPEGGSHRFELTLLALGLEVTNDWVNVRHPFVGWPDPESRCIGHASPEGRTMVVVGRHIDNSGWCYGRRPSAAESNLVYEVRTAGAAFRLDVPTLKSMAPGVYRGSIRYTVGEKYRDFNTGEGLLSLSTDAFELEVQLTVKSDLKIDFPPGSDRAVLEPPRGWSAWRGGRVPPELKRDLPFRLSVNGPFTVRLDCQDGALCYLYNAQRDRVPLKGGLTMPGVTWQGREVLNTAIGTDPTRFEVSRPVVNSPSVLHLKVRDVGDMLRNPGTYRGLVVVVFDSAL